jgi:DNA-binding GntR family transcriptional regulator
MPAESRIALTDCQLSPEDAVRGFLYSYLMSLPSIRQESLCELAYRSLRESIVNGRLAAGSRLVETELAHDLGISRGPLREALSRLAEEGLLIQKPRRGTFVRTLNGDDLVNLYNFRLGIETVAVRLVVRNRRPLDPLADVIDRMRHAAAAGDFESVVEAEFRFHERICELSENPYLLEAIRGLSARLRMALSMDNQTFDELSGRPRVRRRIGRRRSDRPPHPIDNRHRPGALGN